MPRQNQGKGRGQHPLGVQRGPARVGSLEPTVQAESGEVARGPGQKPLPGPSADLGVATGSGALEGAGFACGSREATPVCPIPPKGPSQPVFMEKKGYSHHGLGLARWRVVGVRWGSQGWWLQQGCNMSGLSGKPGSVLVIKTTLFFFFKII